MVGRSPWFAGAFMVAVLALGCRTKPGASESTGRVKVVRVQNPSDDRSGAEHCPADGAPCRPLAPGQEIAQSGIVRTFAGSAVTLDLGGGRQMDLGPLSETKLSAESAQLTRGDIGLSGTPLIQKEPAGAFDFVVGRRTFTLDGARSTLAQFAVSGDTTGVTVRQGRLRGPDVDGLAAGDSVRLTSAGAFRTANGGAELSSLPYVGAARRSLGDLLPEVPASVPRGLGTMTARIPNTDRVLSGVQLTQHHVTVTIVDGIARTEVVEEFGNTTEQVLEGRYRFPIPGDAAVSRLGLWVGDELVEGEVLEAKRARAIYESIVDRPVPRDPALLEWVSAGEMSLKVFPIMPKNQRRVLVAYDQVLPVEGGRLRYTYPLSLGEGRDNTIGDLSIAVHVLDTRGQIDSVRVPSHDARVGREGAWASAYFSERNVTASRDFVVVAERSGGPYMAVDVPTGADLEAPKSSGWAAPTARSRAPVSGFGHFAVRATVNLPEGLGRPPAVVADRAIVLDVSYSQSRETIRAQAAMALAIVSELEPEEGFVLLACDSACAVHAAPAGPLADRRQRAHEFLSTLAPGGASDIAGALVAGSVELSRLGAGGPAKGRQLVLLTDGQASAGELSAASIARVASRHLAPSSVDLRVVGVGRTLDHGRLEQLAIALDAALDFLPSAVLLEQRIFEIAIGLRRPVVRGARVSLPPGLRLAAGTALPALRLGQEVVLTGELLDASPGQLALSGRLAGADYRLAVPLEFSPANTKRNPYIAALFARTRIDALLAEGNGELHRAEIIRLSTTYRTMSPYTSFLVLENDEMFRRFGVERLSQRDAQPAFELTVPEQKDAISIEQNLSEAESAPAIARRGGSSSGPAPASPPSPTTASSGASKPAAAPAKTKKATSGGRAPSSFEPRDDAKYEAERPTEPARASKPSGLGDPLSGDFDDFPGAIVRHRYAGVPRAHLSLTTADDAWRTWAVADLDVARLALARMPESRARMEDFIRRHLAQGRFAEAADVARRFVELDPDYLLAQSLAAQAAVVSGDHELARRMLDVQVETSPLAGDLHRQAASAFENAGDAVRACAHRRTLAELEPADLTGVARANECWNVLLGGPRGPREAASAKSMEAPQLKVEVTCDAGTPVGDCPAPVVVGPDGSVISPWTPGAGDSALTSVSLLKLRSGSYFVLVLGGAPGVRGRMSVVGRHEQTKFQFVAGGLRTVAQVNVKFY